MAQTKTYDPQTIIATFAGLPIVGFADGTMIKVERTEDSFKTYVGSKGEVSRSRSRNKSGFIEFTLAQTSPSNDFLAGMLAQDELLGTGIAPTLVKDITGTSLHMAPEAWVEKPPGAEYGKEIAGRVWRIATGWLETFVGGTEVL